MYVCSVLDEANACVEWAVYTETSWVSELAITKAQMVDIGGQVGVILSIILGFVMVFKALKSM